MLVWVWIFFSAGAGISSVSAIDVTIGDTNSNNLNIGSYQSEGSHVRNNTKLWIFGQDPQFVKVSRGWERWLYYTLVRFARDLKNFFFAIATIFYLIIVIRLILSNNTDEELNNFKKWVIWITVWVIIMQLAYSLTLILYDKTIWETLAFNLVDTVVFPLLRLLETLASIFFLAMAVYTFYRLITANGAEDKIKSAKMTILYSIIWFIVIRFSRTIVESVYGRLNCEWPTGWFITVDSGRCLTEADLNGWVAIIVNIINWANSFIWIVVVLMIMYAWFQVLISWGDEERLKKGKQTVIYIALGLILLVMNYLILTGAAVDIPDAKEITDVSIWDSTGASISGDPIYAINEIGFSILTTLKLALQWVLIIYIVYIGAMMIMSMGNNTKHLTEMYELL